MPKHELSVSPEQIRELAAAIVEATESPALRVHLLRDLLDVPPDDPRVTEAAEALEESRWIRQLAADQHEDGGWGAVHTATYPRTQSIPTTEVAIDRAVALGLPRSHPILERAAGYLRDVLDGRSRFPEGDPEAHVWRIAHAIITGAKLAQIAPDDPRVRTLRNVWAKVFARAFRSGSHDLAAEREAHHKLLGVPIEARSWLMYGEYHDGHHLCKYRTALIASLPNEVGARPNELNPDAERVLLRTACEAEYSLTYFHTPLSKPPKPHPSKVNAWLASWELLAGFRFWCEVAEDAMAWLCSRRGRDGYWDFGPRPTVALFVPWVLPFSESWRQKSARKFDWTARVLLLLNAYLRGDRVLLTHAFDEGQAERRRSAGDRLVRKVLRRDDCGLCVSWP